MEMQEYIDEIKLELTGNLTHLEIPDDTLKQIIKKAFREVQTFINTPKLITIPYSKCIDLSGFNCRSISNVYRAESYLTGDATDNSSFVDPMQIQQWQLLTGGGFGTYNLSDWATTYATWNTALQIRSTISTDLAYKYDINENKIYINCGFDLPKYITIEYIPVYDDVSSIKSPYWVDILQRLSVALTKVILGNIRSKYKQSNALWTLDGDTLKEEGNNELQTLRETLRLNSALFQPID